MKYLLLNIKGTKNNKAIIIELIKDTIYYKYYIILLKLLL